MKAIFERRSIRKYQNKAVPKELIDKIISAGMAAPSARNQQLWHFIILDDRKLLEEIIEYHQYASVLKECPIAIVVCADLLLEKTEGFWIQDCSAATENMLLEATCLGLGSVWLGIYPREKRVEGVQKIFSLPSNVVPLSIVVLGYSLESPKKENRYDTNKIHYNKW